MDVRAVSNTKNGKMKLASSEHTRMRPPADAFVVAPAANLEILETDLQDQVRRPKGELLEFQGNPLID